ncbi:WD40 repeat-containing protein MSI4-like protein [Tanacetum coccineum]
MFNDVKLQVDYECEMAFELLRLVKKQLKEGYLMLLVYKLLLLVFRVNAADTNSRSLLFDDPIMGKEKDFVRPIQEFNGVWLCIWGPQLEQATYKNHQRLYLSEQTDGSVPNTLVIGNCEIVKPKVAVAEHISQFNEEARSPYVKKFKTIIHPGEVNYIRELPQNNNIVATHTNNPDVLIWDVESQPNRHAVLGATKSCLDLILSGHQENAEFALDMCRSEPLVLSGADSPVIQARGLFHRHEDTVEDLGQEFCSVGDDSCLILWDSKTEVEKAHDAYIHCVDWNPIDENLILTGNLTTNGIGSPVHIFENHTAAVLCVQWSPDKSFVFGSSTKDGILNSVVGGLCGLEEKKRREKTMESCMIIHERDKVVDFHWNLHDPWTIVSVSNDDESTGGGGTLQIWRMIDLIYRPEHEMGPTVRASYLQESSTTLPLRTDGSISNTLVIENCKIVKHRVAAAEHILQFNEEARSPYVKKFKTIIHPGEVNHIRELPQNNNIVATHTDNPEAFVRCGLQLDDEEIQLQALVDGKKIIITKASVRRGL